MDWSSFPRAFEVFGYLSFMPFSVSRITCDMMSRAFSLSSAGITYHGAFRVLVALRHDS